jgi:hypothetical protein
VREAAPAASQLAKRAGPLADAAAPALERLGRAAKTGGPILRRAAPTVRALRTFAHEARPTGVLVRQLFDSLREQRVVEGLQDFVYYAAQATARYDRYSHIIPAHLIGSECSQWARTTVPDCNANFAGGGAKAERRAKRARRPLNRDRPARKRRRGGTPAPATAPPAAPGGKRDEGTPRRPEKPGPLPQLPPLDDLPKVPEPGDEMPDADDVSEDLLDFLLGG